MTALIAAHFWESRATSLWQLLDDISTAADIAKGDPVEFQRMALEIADKRCDYAESRDGRTLEWK